MLFVAIEQRISVNVLNCVERVSKHRTDQRVKRRKQFKSDTPGPTDRGVDGVWVEGVPSPSD